MTGTSFVNLGIATGLAAIFTGIPGFECHLRMYDTPEISEAIRPDPQIFQMISTPDTATVPRPEVSEQRCGLHAALDRFPEIVSPMAAYASSEADSACLLVNATGRVDRVAHATLAARHRIEPLMSGLRFRPALRDGQPVSAWVELHL
jgi:hypothetical protein